MATKLAPLLCELHSHTQGCTCHPQCPRSGSRITPRCSRATESYRGGADGQEKTINLLRALGSLFEDLLLSVAGTPALMRNVDLAGGTRSGWPPGSPWTGLSSTTRALVQVESGMRRNLLRSLSLDAMAVGLEGR